MLIPEAKTKPNGIKHLQCQWECAEKKIGKFLLEFFVHKPAIAVGQNRAETI
jgi:hypothetical protein